MEALALKKALEERFKECKPELHPMKTRIVYCKSSNRRKDYPVVSFDFLGFTFRPRSVKGREGKYFVGFMPGVSNAAGKDMRQQSRRWRLQLRSDHSLEDLSRKISPIVRGWINYYARFYKSALYPTLRHLNDILVRWAMRKFKRLRYHLTKAVLWLGRIAKRQPSLFPHWQFGARPTAG
jgi:RNA-directed DNA polymerase